MGDTDEAFFAEWDTRRPREQRGLERARTLLASAGLTAPEPKLLTVVGSKGKGTTAVYASAYLCAAGHRVVTLTSPSLRRSTERIRVDGQAIDEATLARLGDRLASHRPPRTPGGGYLSPSGMFLAAALLHAREVGADYAVLEAGRGGRSDDVSLVPPAVVAVAPIFAEHVALLGGTLAAVVDDKCGVIRASTQAVLVAAQPPETAARIRERVTAESGGRLVATEVTGTPPGVPDGLLPAGLGRGNAALGAAAAQRLLPRRPAPAALARVLGTVSLPGRLSRHRVPGTGTELLVDAAVSRDGFATAAGYASERLGGVDHVLLSVPDDKDLAGAVAEFAGHPVTFVTVPASHLRYTRPLPAAWASVPASRVDRAFLAGLGRRVLAVGTVSFVAHLLEVVDADTARAFRRPRPSSSARGSTPSAP